MTKDKSAIELPFREYVARIKAHPEEKLYARAIPDHHNMIGDRIDTKWIVDTVLDSKYVLIFTLTLRFLESATKFRVAIKSPLSCLSPRLALFLLRLSVWI